jgi:S-adenosylmethionine-diacylglycerol 3-amino-3-carboxypropyl transferase
MLDQLSKEIDFSIIRYANCWEDADVLLQHLALEPNDNVISVASGGDNSFSMLVADNVMVHAVDINPLQLYVCEIKKQAIKALDYESYLRFLGVHTESKRWQLFEQFSNALPAEVLQWANANKKIIRTGIMHHGKFERYFKLFRKFIMPLVHSKKTIAALLASKTAEAQQQFYDEKFNNKRWRYLFGKFFSKETMGKHGRDPRFFEEVDLSVADYIYKKTKEHLSSVACQQNYFIQYIFFGNYTKNLPHYLRKENFERIKKNIDNIIFVKDSIMNYLEAKPNFFTKANCSNIFEYQNDEQFYAVSEQLHNLIVEDGAIAYWNLMVVREHHTIYPHFWVNTPEVIEVDMGFFYRKSFSNIKL